MAARPAAWRRNRLPPRSRARRPARGPDARTLPGARGLSWESIRCPGRRASSDPGPSGYPPTSFSKGKLSPGSSSHATVSNKCGRAPVVDQARELFRRRGNSSPVTLRHPRATAYRCFLPDLTGFTASRRAGPDLQRFPTRTVLTTPDLEREFGPAKAACGYRAPLAPRLARPPIMLGHKTIRSQSKTPTTSRKVRPKRGRRKKSLKTLARPRVYP